MKKVTGARLRPGDVLEVDCGEGSGLLAYLGKHPSLGDLTWVIPSVFASPITEFCSVFSRAGYYQFYPATAALRHGLARKIGFCPEAMRVIPTRTTNMINLNEDGTVRSWTVGDGGILQFGARYQTKSVPFRSQELLITRHFSIRSGVAGLRNVFIQQPNNASAI